MQNTKIIKVLIVDSVTAVRENIRLHLKMIENIYIIGEVGNVDDARIMIFNHRPHLVIIDINLPIKDGFGLLDELKEMPELNLDIIFISEETKHAAKFYEYFPFNFLLKPVDAMRWKEVIEKYASQRFGNKPTVELIN